MPTPLRDSCMLSSRREWTTATQCSVEHPSRPIRNGRFTTRPECGSPPRHRHSQVQPRSVNADSWPTPLAQRYRACGVQAGCHGLSVSGEQSTKVYLVNCCTPVADVASRHRRPANLHRLIVPRYRRSTLCRRASVGGSDPVLELT